jgi:hypothetical protein
MNQQTIDTFSKPGSVAPSPARKVLPIPDSAAAAGTKPAQPFAGGATVLIRNDSKRSLPASSILGIGGCVISPSQNLRAFQTTPILTGVQPRASHESRFCITLEALEPGMIGWASLAGVCAVQIQVTDELHKFATIDTCNYAALISDDRGPAFILWKEPGIGIKWAYVTVQPI